MAYGTHSHHFIVCFPFKFEQTWFIVTESHTRKPGYRHDCRVILCLNLFHPELREPGVLSDWTLPFTSVQVIPVRISSAASRLIHLASLESAPSTTSVLIFTFSLLSLRWLTSTASPAEKERGSVSVWVSVCGQKKLRSGVCKGNGFSFSPPCSSPGNILLRKKG